MENKKPEKKRSEHLSTTIGDMLRSQGNDILKTEKKPYNKKKYNNKQKPYNRNSNKKPNKYDKDKSDNMIKKAIDEAVQKGILKEDDNVKFDLRTPEQIEKDTYKDGVVISDSTMEEFAKAFLAEPEIKEETKEINTDNKFIVNTDYIHKFGSDKRVKTDTFIKK